jgi:hypothetical protein
MRILKRLNWLGIITGVLTLIVVASACLPCEISGENTVGGHGCKYASNSPCGNLSGKVCRASRNKCKLTGDRTCKTNITDVSSCGTPENKHNCQYLPDQSCG